MFINHLLGGIALWLGLCLLSTLYFHMPSPQAQKAYQALLALSDQAKKLDLQRRSKVSQQKRLQVSKQCLFEKDQERMQWRLTSQQSEIVLAPQSSGQLQLIEYFQDVQCTMQEKLLNKNTEAPQQLLRELKAKEATYWYQTAKLEAENVQLMRYLLPTHQWPTTFVADSLLLQGTAEKIQMHLTQNPQLKAQGFQATLHEWEQ